MTESIHDHAPLYVLDALPDDERAAFESHLGACEGCRSEVRRLSDASAELAETSPASPPDRLRATVLSGIQSVAQEGVMHRLAVPVEAGPSLAHSLWRRFGVPAAAAVAAVAVIIFGLLAVLGEPQDRPLRDVLAADDARLIELEGSSGNARFVFSVSEATGVLIANRLDPVPPGTTYQLWIIEDAQAVSAGVFASDDGSVTHVVDAELAALTAVAVSIEPAGGSTAPTGEVTLVGSP